MASRTQTADAPISRVYAQRWSRIGQNLYKIHGDRAHEVAEDEAKAQLQDCEAKIRAIDEQSAQVTEDRDKAQADLDQDLNGKGVTVEGARIRYKGATLGLGLCAVMVTVGIFIIAWSLGPHFYGHEVLWLAVSIGLGLAPLVGMKVLLSFMEKILNPRQFSVFNALIAAVMVAFFIVGFVQLSEARALQIKMSRIMDSDSMFDDQMMLDLDKVRQRLDDLVRRAMIFLGIGFEWLVGVFFYLSARSWTRHGSTIHLARRRDAMTAQYHRFHETKAFLEKVDEGKIVKHLRNGIEEARTKGSVPFMVTVIVIVLGVLIGSVLLSENAFGGLLGSSNKRCRYFLISYDVTGSTEHDQQENQRAIIKIINSLRACDEFQLMNITQATFSDPEYMIHHKMPSRAGYFKEEIRRHRLRLVSEFRSKAERIAKSRPATSIIEGLYMFSHMLQERRGTERVLVLISDMLEHRKDMTPAKIASRGTKVLSQLKSEGLIPDMTGIQVYVMGASTAGIDAGTWRGVKNFWVSYFKMAGACLRCYTIQRHWPVD